MWNFFSPASTSSIVFIQIFIFSSNMHNTIIHIGWWWEKYLSKCSLIKSCYSWLDKRFVLGDCFFIFWFMDQPKLFFFSKWKKNLQTFYFYFVFQCYNARIAFCILTVNDEHNKTNLGLKQSVQVKFKDGICAKLCLKL